MQRILLIEDNEANGDLISRYLELFEYDVILARDGVSGLETAIRESSEIQLVLMDMNLPEMDGWEVTRRLRANEQTRSLPIIAVTAHAMVGDREKTLSAGCDDFATKPIDFGVLIDKMQALITKANSR